MDLSSFSAQVLESYNQQAAAASGFQNIVGNVPFPIASTFAAVGAPQPGAGLAVSPATPTAAAVVPVKTAKVRSAKQVVSIKRTVSRKTKEGGVSSSSSLKQNQSNKVEGRRKWSPNRKAAGFWSPFNDWWRLEFEKLKRRPTTEEVSEWYTENADKAWPGQQPTIKVRVNRIKY